MSVDALTAFLGTSKVAGAVPAKKEGYITPSKGKFVVPYSTKNGEQVYQAPIRDNVYVAPCWSNGDKHAALFKGQNVAYLQNSIPVASRNAQQALNRKATLVFLSEVEDYLKEHPEGGYFESSLFGGQWLTVFQKEEEIHDFDAEEDCI